MINDFLNGKFNIKICSLDRHLISELVRRLGNIKWGSGLDFNGHYVYGLMKRGDPFWLGVEEDGKVYVSHFRPWKETYYPLEIVLGCDDKISFDISEDELVKLMGD